ncbi:MAG: formate/nitrite transporter family protein [Intestinibacter sp.]|uniref:formate/nitrite transporter family protein n=1 Tax=Intestinibacter sp. TaxID=1965304 RepID=UPI002A80A2B8|nr:formate/nitrite transporter family protein [Intestinibacter sp.]MDY4575717.1 formate/nitrite transporter family protein [Intestinibacter sp.]
MSSDTVNLLTKKSRAKIDLLNQSRLKYLVSAMFAGIYVGIGVILVFTIGGMLYQVHSPMTKVAVGLSFSVALSLILILGNELFTSNNMVMTVGAMAGEASKRDTLKVLGYSYLGNFLGALLVASLFIGTGLFKDSTLMYFEYSALAKVSPEAHQLFFRGVLCNILVCAGVLAAYKLKDETSRLIIVFLSLFAFVTSGFEHCIANMATFLVCIISNSTAVTLGGMIHNLFFVTLGNLVGGILFLGVGTYLLSSGKDK